MANGKPNWVLIVAAILVATWFLNPFGLGDQLKGLLKGGAPTTEPKPSTEEPCYTDKTTMTLGPAKAFYNSTSLTTAGHRLVVNGVDRGMYTDGDLVSVSPGNPAKGTPADIVDIYYCYNTTPAYYATTKDSFTVPCKGAIASADYGTSKGKCYPQRVSNGTMKIFNEDNGNLNADADRETLANGDIVTLPFELTGNYETAYSPFGKIIMVLEGNTSDYEELKLVNGVVTAIPNQFALGKIYADGRAWAYEMPGCKSICNYKDNILIKTKGTGTSGITATDSIQITMYDQEYFVKKDGTIGFGVEDDSYANVGLTDWKLTIDVD